MASPNATSDEIPIPIGSGSGGRSASKNCTGFRVTLPKWVSGWGRWHVENVLHIFYDQNTSGIMPQLLEKIPKLKKITSEQKKYMEILRNLNFGPNLNARPLWTDWICDEVEEEVKEARLEAESKDFISMLPKLGPWLHICLRKYFEELKDFVDLRRQTWIKDANDELLEPRVFEEEYSLILSAFASLCGLSVKKGYRGNRANWINLRGNYVTSIPDFRFHARGQNFQDDNTNLLTVVEVKAKTKQKTKQDDALKRKLQDQQDQSEIRAKRRCTTSMTSTYSSSTSSRSELQSSTVHAFQTGGNVKKPHIANYIGDGTLGQHAGELLLDLNKYVTSSADISTTSILYMPGMIVDRTMVHLTLLEISTEHFKKLTGTEQPLTKGDKATIYYSKSLDIMVEKERRMLIDTFVTLNNFESLLK